MTVPRIDAHQHFWRYAADDFPWIEPSMAQLPRDWLPGDLRPLLDAKGLNSCIAVQARALEAETDFLLTLAREHPWIAAVVGWVDLRAADLDRRLARWRSSPALAGFRHLLQDDPDVSATLDDPAFNHGVRELQERGLVYELLVRGPDQLELLPAFCTRHDRHWLILDHIGKPAIGGDTDDRWNAAIHELAKMPHVACKLSGLVTEVVGARIEESQVQPYLDTALESFGPDRLMFGSDWPVCLLRSDYDGVCSIVEHWAATALGAEECTDLWGGTADRCYGLTSNAVPGGRA